MNAEESLAIFSELCTNFKVLPKNIKCSLFYLLKNNQ